MKLVTRNYNQQQPALQLTAATFMEIREHNNYWISGFEASADYNTISNIANGVANNMSQMLNNGTMYNGAVNESDIVTSNLITVGDPLAEVNISNGWNIKRFTVFLMFRQQMSMNSTRIYYVQGYTDGVYMGANNQFDPNMSIFVDKVSVSTEIVDRQTGAVTVKPMHAVNVISEQSGVIRIVDDNEGTTSPKVLDNSSISMGLAAMNEIKYNPGINMEIQGNKPTDMIRVFDSVSSNPDNLVTNAINTMVTDTLDTVYGANTVGNSNLINVKPEISTNKIGAISLLLESIYGAIELKSNRILFSTIDSMVPNDFPYYIIGVKDNDRVRNNMKSAETGIANQLTPADADDSYKATIHNRLARKLVHYISGQMQMLGLSYLNFIASNFTINNDGFRHSDGRLLYWNGYPGTDPSRIKLSAVAIFNKVLNNYMSSISSEGYTVYIDASIDIDKDSVVMIGIDGLSDGGVNNPVPILVPTFAESLIGPNLVSNYQYSEIITGMSVIDEAVTSAINN